MIGIEIDAREFEAFAANCRRAPEILAQENQTAGRQAGFLVVGKAQQLAPRDTGNMANQIGPPEVSRLGGTGVQIRIAASAQSRDGFPYPIAVEEGRGPIEAGPGKVLAFEVGGRMVFTKRVGPARAQPFMRPALQQSRAQIVALFGKALQRAADRMVD